MKKRCFGYVRVSTEEQREYSPDSQIRLLEAYADKHEMTILRFFQDLGISGRTAEKRPQFQEMILQAQQGECDAILVWKYSRFARNQEESVLYKSLLRKRGVEVISISEELPQDWLASRLVESIYEIMDEQYSRNLSLEVRRGMEQKALKGGYNGPLPMGYVKQSDPKLPPCPEETYARIVQRIFSEFLSGRGPSQIAAGLNEDGLRTKRGRPFDNRLVCYVLQNPFYAGYVRFNHFHRKTGTYETHPILTKAAHPPLIDEDAFQQVQRRLQRPDSRRKDPAPSRKHWLCGLLQCGACQSHLSFHSGGRENKTAYFYCWRHAKGACPARSYVNAQQAEATLLPLLKKLFSTDIGDVYVRKAPEPEPRSEQALLQASLSTLQQQETRSRTAYLNGIESLEEYARTKQRIQRERQRLLQRQKELEQPASPSSEVVLHDLWELLVSECSVSEKSLALREVCEGIVYREEAGLLELNLRAEPCPPLTAHHTEK